MATPPQLPLQVVDTILSFLLPPSIPLPQTILAQPLRHRLSFLPPDHRDLDAWLTPTPRKHDLSPTNAASQVIHDRLQELAILSERDEISYASDGETLFAKLPLRRPDNPNHQDGVDIIFAYEKGAEDGSWVYHASETAGTTDLDWTPDVISASQRVVSLNDEDDELDHAGPAGTAPTGYWGDTSPNIITSEIRLDDEVDNEDDYWRSYGSGSGLATPQIDQEGKSTLSKAPTPRQVSLTSSPRTATSLLPKATSHREANDLRDKFKSKISLILRLLWSDWTKGCTGERDMVEERALEWLRLSRQALKKDVHTNGNALNGTSDSSSIVLASKIEILRDMYEVVDESEDGFWRLVEEVIRMPANVHADPVRQEDRWE